MTKKKIGLVASKTGENSFGSTINYIMFAERFGEVILLMPDHEVRDDLDLLILPGGADVSVARYGQTPNWFTGKPDIFKEHFDEVYLPQYIANGTPICAICRGFQSLYVTLGGSLIQHMNHETNDMAKDQFSAVHDMMLLPNFTSRTQFTDKVKLPINSRHHQIIDVATCPEDLSIVGVHCKFRSNNSDGSPEMYLHDDLPIVGFQFHPEDVYEPDTYHFINNVVNTLIETKQSILIPVEDEVQVD